MSGPTRETASWTDATTTDRDVLRDRPAGTGVRRTGLGPPSETVGLDRKDQPDPGTDAGVLVVVDRAEHTVVGQHQLLDAEGVGPLRADVFVDLRPPTACQRAAATAPQTPEAALGREREGIGQRSCARYTSGITRPKR